MMFNFKIVTPLLAFFILVFAGCASKEYIYTPPASEAGLQCVMQCQSTNTKCQDFEKKKASIEQERCELKSADEYYECREIAEIEYTKCEKESDKEYIACLKYADNRDKCHKEDCAKKKRDRCYRSSCNKSPKIVSCKHNYRECYKQCGGMVEEVE